MVPRMRYVEKELEAHRSKRVNSTSPEAKASLLQLFNNVLPD